MTTVITYGTFDLLHYGHIRLLKRAKALGDYLIVGVTADDFDKIRGKINIQQSLMERIEAVKNTGIADRIIVEEYLGQKIDDIKKYHVNVFTVGSDWIGHFDYLNNYCKVIYLPRTEGVSSTEIRSQKRKLKIGIVGEELNFLDKFYGESQYVNGIDIVGLYSQNAANLSERLRHIPYITDNYNELLDNIDAVYLISHPSRHYEQIKEALLKYKHILCESPIVTDVGEYEYLVKLAKNQGCLLVDALRTAYSTAYARLLVLVQSGIIGNIVSIDATCTSLRYVDFKNKEQASHIWNSITSWGPTAMLPIFQILGPLYTKKWIITHLINQDPLYDDFTKVDFLYPHATASIKVGKGVKSEGELIISGTKGYVYVPAPWWKTDYFETRFENLEDNKRYFYQLDGEGIRYELVAFCKAIEQRESASYIDHAVSKAIVQVLQDFYTGREVNRI